MFESGNVHESRSSIKRASEKGRSKDRKQARLNGARHLCWKFSELKQIGTTTSVPRYFKRRCLSRDLFTPITSFGFRSPTQMRAWQYGGSDACCFEFQTGQKCWTGWSIPPTRAFSRGFCWIFSRRQIYCSVDVYESKFGASTRR